MKDKCDEIIIPKSYFDRIVESIEREDKTPTEDMIKFYKRAILRREIMTTSTKSLEQMSDMELECRLHNILGLDGDGSDSLNYCSDWNATMPLAVENSIEYITFQNEYAAHNGLETFYYSEFSYCDSAFTDKYAKDENPLRAIVMCLIKVLKNN